MKNLVFIFAFLCSCADEETPLCTAVLDFELNCIDLGGKLVHSKFNDNTWVMFCNDGSPTELR